MEDEKKKKRTEKNLDGKRKKKGTDKGGMKG